MTTNTDAVVTSIAETSSESGTLGIGDTITFTLTTDQTIYVTQTAELTLSNGGYAVYAGLDGNGNPTFTYTVAEGDTATTDLTVTGLDASAGKIYGPGSQVSLATQTLVNTGNLPFSIATGDFDGDGKLDLVTANQSDDTVSVRLGNGDGSFSDTATLAVGSCPSSIAVADVNGDGKLDMLVANQQDNTVSVLLGNGDGSFASASNIAAGNSPSSVTVADVNGDGKLDLLIADEGTDTVSVQLGDGAGSFSASADIAVGTDPYVVSLADIDGDGKLDLVTANYSSDSLSVRFGDGSGGFSGGSDIGIIGHGTSVAAADVDGDGKLDMVTVDYARDTLSVLLGNGDGTFTSVADIGMTGDPISVVLADMNGDGKLDLVAAKRYDGAISMLLGNADGTFSNQIDINVGSRPRSITLVDVNGDGKLDVLVGNQNDNTVSVLLNTSADSVSFDTSSIASATGADSGYAVDARRPDAPSVVLTHDTGSTGTDTITSNAALTITCESGATLSYIVDGGAASGSYDPTGLADGDHTVIVTQTDAAGNVSNATTITFTLDTSITAPSILLTDDTGTSSADQITSDGTMSTVTTELGATLSYVVDGGTASSSYDPTALADGQHTVAITETDLAGNVSTSASITFTLDTSAAAPTVSLTNDTGSSSTDTVTNDGSLTIGGKETGATLSYSVDGGTASGSYDPTALADGQHTVTVIQTDKAGNVSTAGSITFTLDRTVPDAPGLALTDDTGTSSTDNVTSDGSLTITGKEAGATLSYVVDGGSASGSYDPTALAEGQHTVSITQTDAAGNVSAAGSITFTLDYSGATPVIRLTSDTGTSSADQITSDAALTVTGIASGATLTYVVDGGTASSSYDPTALADGEHTVTVTQTNMAGVVSAAGSITFTLDTSAAAPTVSLTDDTGSSDTDEIASNGALTITKESGATLSYSVDGGSASSSYDPTALADGQHTVTVTQTDKAGNVSTAGSITFTLDTSAAAPTVGLTDDTGSSSTDNVTSDATLTMTKEADATLSYVVDGGTASSSYDPTALADGQHTVSVTETDKAGNVSTATRITFTLDRGAPSAPSVALTADTGSSDSDHITGNAALTITGTETSATLSYVIDGGAATASYDPSALDDGQHTVSITETDAAGNASTVTSITFTLDRDGITAPVVALTSDTGASGTDNVSSNVALTVTGTETDATLNYTVDGVALTGSYDPSALTDGQHTVSVTQTDEAGNVSMGGSVTFTLDRTAPTVTGLVASGSGIVNGSGTLTTGDTVALSLTLSEAVAIANGDSLSLSLSDGAHATFDAGASTATTLVFTYTVALGDTAADLSVTNVQLHGASLTDAAGNVADLSGAVGNPAGTLVINGDTGTAGKDSIKGTDGDDALRSLGGDDVISGRGGDDMILGGAGNDKISGGRGNDNLRGGAGDAGHDTLVGDAGDDTLRGGPGRDMLSGGAGDDNLYGVTGNDRLLGGAGDDELHGGQGADRLVGGTGHDTFVFSSLSSSTVKSAGRDTIADFGKGDHIDLSTIDASSDVQDNQSFSFIGIGSFDGSAGELRYETQGADTYVYADTDGDGHADFSLQLNGIIKLSREDFIL